MRFNQGYSSPIGWAELLVWNQSWRVLVNFNMNLKLSYHSKNKCISCCVLQCKLSYFSIALSNNRFNTRKLTGYYFLQYNLFISAPLNLDWIWNNIGFFFLYLLTYQMLFDKCSFTLLLSFILYSSYSRSLDWHNTGILMINIIPLIITINVFIIVRQRFELLLLLQILVYLFINNCFYCWI